MDGLAEFGIGQQEYVTDVAESTEANRFGRNFSGGGEAEYLALKKLYALAPDKVAKPYGLVREDGLPDGQVKGYRREFILGKSVLDYLRNEEPLPDGTLDEIVNTFNFFLENNTPHGDINAQNILITPNGKIKIIDPVGYGNIPADDLPEYLNYDRERLKDLQQLVINGLY